MNVVTLPVAQGETMRLNANRIEAVVGISEIATTIVTVSGAWLTVARGLEETTQLLADQGCDHWLVREQ